MAADGPIRDVHDLKGKTIGVFSLATGGIAFLKSYLKQNGMDPDHDVSLVPVGLGAPAVDAMRTGKVQALLFWAAAMAGFENAGLNLRYLSPDDWRGYPDLSLTTLAKTATADPRMIEAIARGSAKASVFAIANPDCVRRLQWAHFPTTKPSGADEATLERWDMRLLDAQLTSMRQAYTLNGGASWGRVDPVGFGRIQTFMLDAKQITKTIPPETYLLAIPNFTDEVNHFDAGAVRQAAVACQTP